MLHSPVLLEESIDFLITNPSGKYIDATFGRGGHSRKILDSISKDGALLALDKDLILGFALLIMMTHQEALVLVRLDPLICELT